MSHIISTSSDLRILSKVASLKRANLASNSEIFSISEFNGMGETDLDLDRSGDFVKFCGISSFLTGSVGKSNGLFGINKPLGSPDNPGKFVGSPAAAKLDVKEAKLVGRPPAKLDARLEGNPGDIPGIDVYILECKEGCCPGLDAGGNGNLGIGGPPGIPGPPVSGGTPPLSSCPNAAEDCGGTPGIPGSLKPGGITGVIPAIGLFTFGVGSPFFSASSIFCNKDG